MTSGFRLCFLLLPVLAVTARAESIPLEDLPSHLDWRDDALSLVADFSDCNDDGSIPVYLINATPVEVELDAQDHDVYMRLEYRDADGNWRRAQSLPYSRCGNSFRKLTVPPCRYVRLKGYQPTQGDTHTIRYAIYRGGRVPCSNIGTGLVAMMDVARAKFDAMTIVEGDFEFVAGVALGTLAPDEGVSADPRYRGRAIRALLSRKFDARCSREILQRVIRESPECKEEAMSALSVLDANQNR